jgi:hypothetical protein
MIGQECKNEDFFLSLLSLLSKDNVPPRISIVEDVLVSSKQVDFSNTRIHNRRHVQVLVGQVPPVAGIVGFHIFKGL